MKKLIKAYDPERIILFGSCARGEPKIITTIDLMVIAESKERFIERIRRALEICKGGPPSFEVIVYTPKEFDHLWQQGEGFLEDALEEGVVLYDKE